MVEGQGLGLGGCRVKGLGGGGCRRQKAEGLRLSLSGFSVECLGL